MIVATGVELVLWPVEPTGPSVNQIAAFGFTAVMISSALGYFVSIWSAANALMRFENREEPAGTARTFGTFLLEFYLPIGIWFLHPRIKRLLAAPLPSPLLVST